MSANFWNTIFRQRRAGSPPPTKMSEIAQFLTGIDDIEALHYTIM